jgi:glycosyltransferase involved in cell wall biosynthesis
MIVRMRPQFAYAHLPKSALLLRIAARLAGVPMVFHFHGAVEDADISSLYKRILGTAAHIVCVSEGSRQQLLRCGIDNEATVLYNGLEREWLLAGAAPVSARAEFGIPADAFAFGFVGNIIPRKGIDTLISGFAILLSRLPADDRRCACLVIVGDDPIPTRPYRTALEQLAASLGVSDHVRFYGASRQIRTFMNSIDVFVLASRMESFGVVLAEAMSQGVAVISTRTGSIPEVVRDGETGLLVPSEQPDALADAMQRLYSDGSLRTTLGSAGRAWVREQFSQERIAKELLQVLGEYRVRR